MKILITGGAGFIGQHLATALVGHELTALDTLLPQVHDDPDADRDRFPGEVVAGDVSDPGVWAELGRHDAIVHLAAETGTAQSMYEQDRYRTVNVEGTRLAGEFAARWGAPLVALSSRAVYGEGAHGADGEPAASREDDSMAPVSVYGETKVEAEQSLAWLEGALPVTILRPQNVVGHGQALRNPYTGVLAAFLARLREGRPVQVYGDGHETRDFVHVSDVAAVIVWALTRNANETLVVNVGTGTRTSLLDLATWAIEASPVGGTLEHVDVHRAGDIEHACADLARLRAAGAPMPQVTSQQAIHDFITRSWHQPGVDSSVWDDALAELRSRGLAQ